MKATRTDPIIAELRAVRDEHTAQCGHDVEAIFRDIRARQQASRRRYVSLPPRRVPSAPGGEHRPSHELLIPQTTSHSPGRQTPTASKDEEATFGHYMVGVFDVLGQSRKLRAQTGIPPSDDPIERQRAIANLKDTAGVVIGFRGLFRKFFEGAAEPTGLVDALPGPQRAEMLAAMARSQFSRAHDNVRAHCRNFRDAGEAKLASRYELLRTYFDERASQWHT